MKLANLRQKLLLLTLLPASLLALVLVVYFTWVEMDALEGELKQRGVAIVRYLAPASEFGVMAGHMESLQGLVQATVQQPGVKSVLVTHRDGRVLAVSGKISVAGSELMRLADKAGVVAVRDLSMVFAAPIVRSQLVKDDLFDPLPAAGDEAGTLGQVLVEIDTSDLLAHRQVLMLRGLVIILLGLLGAGVLAYRLADSFTQPILRLVDAVREMGAGGFTIRVATSSSGEIGELERGFNEMAERVQGVHDTMQARIEEATAQLAYQARHDALTGLVNRREFEARLERALATVLSGGENYAVLFIDLDRFKQVNDQAGHLAGDELLRQLSRLFDGRLRDEDTLARLGGDEFGVLLHCNGQDALTVANDLCHLASSYRFVWQGKIFSVGASIGLVELTQNTRSITDVLGAGDACCYAAKANGRNCVQVHRETPLIERRLPPADTWARLEHALRGDALHLSVAPIMSLAEDSDEPTLAELLVRVEESAGLRPLAALMEAAERYECARDLDLKVQEAVLSALSGKPWLTGVCLLLPVSVSFVRDPQAVSLLVERMHALQVPASTLALQISEEWVSRDQERVTQFAACLAEHGLGLVLGEFGGWLASFSHLHVLKPDYVRITSSLTRDLSGSRSAAALTRAVSEVADDLDILTIAEGIEDPVLLDNLRTWGIDYVAGAVAGPEMVLGRWHPHALTTSAANAN